MNVPCSRGRFRTSQTADHVGFPHVANKELLRTKSEIMSRLSGWPLPSCCNGPYFYQRVGMFMRRCVWLHACSSFPVHYSWQKIAFSWLEGKWGGSPSTSKLRHSFAVKLGKIEPNKRSFGGYLIYLWRGLWLRSVPSTLTWRLHRKKSWKQ